jgi:putative transport protein
MIDLLLNNPLLLLFLVIAVGYPLGKIKFAGSSLGLAAVLFAGLAFGALHPDMKLPELVYQLGLVLFVYTIGLSSGHGFFTSLRNKGLRDNALVLGVLLLAFALTAGLHFALGLKGTFTAGMFAGALTNTPALAGVLEYIKNNAPQTVRDPLLAEPVVAYSLTYPVGVIGMLAAIAVAQRLWRVDYAAEAAAHKELGGRRVTLNNRTVRVTRSEVTGIPLIKLKRQHGWDVLVVRQKRAGHLALTTGEARLALGDDITIVGSDEELDRFTAGVGEPSAEHIELDRSEFDFRRIFVSDHRVAGRRLRDLDLSERFEALITRIRRGDVDLLPHGDTQLELGDRVRVVARREQMGAVTRFFGDSYREVSEVDILTFSLGLALGLLAGLIPIPLPGGAELKLGLAGGPLLVALILGSSQRTGPFVWNVPYGANMTLRQIGLVLFLAGVGTRAGYAFVSTLAQGGGLALFFGGALVTSVSALTLLWVGHRGLQIPLGFLIGMLAGFQTQPAVLGFASEQARNDLPNLGYATVYPLATIAKIILAQLLLAWLRPF